MIYNIKHVSLKRPNLAIISLKDIILTDDGEWKLLTIYIFQPNNCLLIFWHISFEFYVTWYERKVFLLGKMCSGIIS